MDTSTQGAIVVGVTGPGREQAALRFAADCARRDGVEVVLVHAFHTAPPTPPPSVLITSAEAADVAERIVKEVADEFAELVEGSVEVHALAVSGHPSRVLVDLSRGARMIVVQHRDQHGLGRIFAGSTVTHAGAHAECPVVSVPPGWQPDEPAGEVVVGVHEGGGPAAVLEAGFAWATATGVPLRVVHAWRLDAAYDDLVTSRDEREWRDEQRKGLEAVVSGLCELHPAVHVEIEVRHQFPIDTLVDDSRAASLVVVGRHSAHRWAPVHLGSIARTVLREAKSPVLIVPVAGSEGSPDDWDLSADEISPQT